MVRLIITFVLFLNISASANFYLEGYLIDQHTSSPIRDATISVLNNDAQLTTSDETGYFLLENIDKAIVDIIVTKAGYYAEIVNQIDLINSNNTQLRIALIPNVIELENVIVTAKRSTSNNNKAVVGVCKS